MARIGAAFIEALYDCVDGSAGEVLGILSDGGEMHERAGRRTDVVPDD